MALLDEVTQEEVDKLDPTSAKEYQGLIPGYQKPAGVMTQPGVVTQVGASRQQQPMSQQEQAQASRSIDLQQLGKLAMAAKGLPENLRTQLLATYLGIPLKTKEQQAMEGAMQRALLQHQDRQAQAKNTEIFRQKQVGQADHAARINLAKSISKLQQDLQFLKPGTPEYSSQQKMLSSQQKLYNGYIEADRQREQAAQDAANQKEIDQNPGGTIQSGDSY